MHIAKSVLSGVGLTLMLAPLAAAQSGTDKSPLAPLVPGVRALVSRAQPRADFATGKDILIGQYRTHNYSVRLRGGDGRRLPPFEQLGPRPGGFYLQIAVGPASADTKTHVTPPVPSRPWTTVTSVYPLSDGRKAIFLTWEAGPGAPAGLLGQVAHTLSQYVSAH